MDQTQMSDILVFHVVLLREHVQHPSFCLECDDPEFGHRVYQCPPIHHRIQGGPGNTQVSAELLGAGVLLFRGS